MWSTMAFILKWNEYLYENKKVKKFVGLFYVVNFHYFYLYFF